MLARLFITDKILTEPYKKKIVFLLMILAHRVRELERNNAAYNMVAEGNRVSHNWKWTKARYSSPNPSQ